MDPADELSNNKWESFLYSYRIPITLILIGFSMIGVAFFFYKQEQKQNDDIQVIENEKIDENMSLVIEIAGAVESPGVYSFVAESRIDDALIAAGGLSADADREWVQKSINRAARLIDGQKIYIASVNEQSDVLSANSDGGYQTISGTNSSNIGEKININSASQSQLESLWGIGPVYAQKIIEQRPYSNTEELLSKKIIKSNVYERIKDEITIY